MPTNRFPEELATRSSWTAGISISDIVDELVDDLVVADELVDDLVVADELVDDLVLPDVELGVDMPFGTELR